MRMKVSDTSDTSDTTNDNHPVQERPGKARRGFIRAVRIILYSFAAYCFIFSVWTYPVFIKNLIDYSRYLKADADEVCVSELCRTRWLPKIKTRRLKGRLDYIAWYNFSKMTKFENLHLKGQSEDVIEKVFGKASTRISYDPPHWTYNYHPFPNLAMMQFQVHCKDGIIQSAEMFD